MLVLAALACPARAIGVTLRTHEEANPRALRGEAYRRTKSKIYRIS